MINEVRWSMKSEMKKKIKLIIYKVLREAFNSK